MLKIHFEIELSNESHVEDSLRQDVLRQDTRHIYPDIVMYM